MFLMKYISKISAASAGSLAFVFALIATTTEGWWTSENGSHGLWTVTNGEGDTEKGNIPFTFLKNCFNLVI